MTKWMKAPALEIDAQIAAIRGKQVALCQRQRVEREVAWNVIKRLEAAGWALDRLNDTEEVVKVADAKAAMELLFNLDEAWVGFRKGRQGAWVRFIFGNGGWDAICDYSVVEGFQQVIDGVVAEADKLYG